MKNARRQTRAKAKTVEAAPAERQVKAWHWLLGLFLAALAVFEAYQPAINGPFLFDDSYLPMNIPGFPDSPLAVWLSGVRPLLMFTYWFNYRTSGLEPYFYHVFNVLLHLGTAVLVFFIARRILEWSGVAFWPRIPVALFSAALFLLHPLQTESVAYVAGRSETLSVFLFYAAFAVFVCRRAPAISFPLSGAVLMLFAGAVLTKEHTAVLPALLLLTDYFWNPGFSLQGIRRNWRLYVPLAVLGGFGLRFVWGVLSSADTAGFAMKELPWHHYFFTQCRAIWVYLRLFVLPYGQSLDHEFAISRSPLDHGAVIGFAALVALVIAAWVLRRRYPLASFGILTFLLMLAPTSSVVPIKDPLVERRLYLPSVGLLFVAAEFLRCWAVERKKLVFALVSVLAAAGVLTYGRNQVWNSPVALWEDTVTKSPGNPRAHFQLAYAYYHEHRCNEAIKEYTRAAELQPADHRLLVDWALAYDCASRPAEALVKLEQAAAMERTAHVYSLIGMVHGKQGNHEEALRALETSASLDPNFAMTYVYRGNVYAARGQAAQAVAEYRKALELDKTLQAARDALALTEQQLLLNR